ncbi:MAG: hypothetical protein FJ146_09535 [Deltaproteobacteria bacterium]|nr:hypothetical protein [Deltaproteobacteria bacterium]
MREAASKGQLETGDMRLEVPEEQSSQGLPDFSGDEGMPLDAYAERHLLSVDEVWQKIRRGELLGRMQQGRLLIFSPETSEHPFADLPPLPGSSDPGTRAAGTAERNGSDYLSLSGERGQTPELALLLDHLSLAKEENREILKLTEQSMQRVCAMSEQLVQMKDAVIQAKDAELAALKAQREMETTQLREQLQAREHEIRRLRQHSEDLEMLARTMASQAETHE